MSAGPRDQDACWRLVREIFARTARPRPVSPDQLGVHFTIVLFNKDDILHAVQTLREIDGHQRIGIVFSAGGTALWRAVKAGLNLHALICVSSTRPRFETSPPNIPTMVIWGELDPSRPTEDWNNAVPGGWKTYTAKQHDFYRRDISTPKSTLLRNITAFVEDCSPLRCRNPMPPLEDNFDRCGQRLSVYLQCP